MKKLLASALMLTVVAGAVIWRTGAFFSDTETSNDNTFTAGGLDLQIDSEAHYNHMVCVNNQWQPEPGFQIPANHYPIQGTACSGSWELTDLVDHKFFDFADVKPGDMGENTISMHVNNNDAWACVDITNVRNEDNLLTDPETQSGDTLLTGELAQNLQFFAWQDDGDNVWESGELPFTDVPISGTDLLNGDFTIPLAAPDILPAIQGGETKYIGLTWCVGTMSIPESGVISCSGDSVGNDVQTDSLIADISFRIEQARNNPNFSCGEPVNTRRVGAVLGAYTRPTACDITVADGNSIQNAINSSTNGQTICVDAGTYTGNVNVNKDITLAGDGASATSVIEGLVDLTADGATFEGFKVLPGTNVPNQEAGITVTASNVLIDSNFIYNMGSTAGGSIKGIYLYGGNLASHISNITVTNNRVELMRNSAKGTYGVMVQGAVDGVNISRNTIFDLDTDGWGASGIEVTPTGAFTYSPTSIMITRNHIEKTRGTSEQGKAITIDWANSSNKTDASQVTLTQNNFVDTPVDVRNLDDVHTLLAPNNWWGDLSPVVEGDVDSNPVATSAFPTN